MTQSEFADAEHGLLTVRADGTANLERVTGPGPDCGQSTDAPARSYTGPAAWVFDTCPEERPPQPRPTGCWPPSNTPPSSSACAPPAAGCGYRGRTLSSAAGPHWLRLVCTEAGTEGGTLWNGPSTSRALPPSVPRPGLIRIRDWTTDRYAYRAELYALAPDPMVSLRPVLDQDPDLPGTWWKEMTAALEVLAELPPRQTAKPYARSTCAA